jgi:hypothetical protein
MGRENRILPLHAVSPLIGNEDCCPMERYPR